MSYKIDAWLEREDPMIRVLDQSSGATLLSWRSEQIHWLMERGYLGYEDFDIFKNETEQWLAGDLLELERSYSMDPDGSELAGSLHRESPIREYLQSSRNLITIGSIRR